jgi:hypothetical protein
MTHHSPIPPVRRLDPHAAIAQVNAETGAGLAFAGMASGGQVGAAFVRWPDGREGVLTIGGDDIASAELTTATMNLAREKGIPCPHYDLIHHAGQSTIIIQQRLPGLPPTRITRNLVRQMVGLNERFAGVLEGQPGVPALDLFLTHSGPGFCIHESLERHDDSTRRLLDWVRQVGRDFTGMTGTDLVHADFHPGNVLVDESGTITGIVDWDSAARGDRRFALVTLAFDLGWGIVSSPGNRDLHASDLDWLLSLVDSIEQPLRRAYWAHMSLRLVDWSIRHHTAVEVTHYLDFAATRMRD